MSVKISYRGRLGNKIMTYLMAQYLAEKNDLAFDVEFPENINDDFIINKVSGKRNYSEFTEIIDANIIHYMKTPINSGIHVNDHFQWKEVWENQDVITKYKTYMTPKPLEPECDLFVSVRLGDITGVVSLPIEYYSETLEKIKFSNGFISSDSPEHPIVLQLIKRFNLKLFSGSPAHKIRYASMCKNIVLSSGTFCFLQGFFSKNSNVYFIDDETMQQKLGIRQWTGGMFNAFLQVPNWIPYKKH